MIMAEPTIEAITMTRSFVKKYEWQIDRAKGALSEGGYAMSQVLYAAKARPTAIPVAELLPWVIFGGLLLLLTVYFVGAEEGATSIIRGMYVHEFLHDGRHLLGFPCH
jgi:Probable cobalt transporter subunit (CbtB)